MVLLLLVFMDYSFQSAQGIVQLRVKRVKQRRLSSASSTHSKYRMSAPDLPLNLSVDDKCHVFDVNLIKGTFKWSVQC